MPEYGRNVQRMVEYALTIEDKQERQQCVQAIMRTMSNLFPYLRNEESKHKMYDHLAIMSNFKLDIDFPYNRPSPEQLRYTPQQLPYNTQNPVRFRHYGKIIETLLDEAAKETDKEKQQQMVMVIANRMKQNYMIWNKDNTVDDNHIIDDIRRISRGKIDCNFDGFQLAGAKQLAADKQQKNQQKRKRKKNR